MEQSDDFRIGEARLVLSDLVEHDLADIHAVRSDPDVARLVDFASEMPGQ